MFYLNQTDEQRNEYKAMLKIIGNLTRLFSESEAPYLPYRAHENIFCKYFSAENLARVDCSADAKKNAIGIGLKTWVGRDDQKVAEFGRLRHTYSALNDLTLVKKIAEYRNERIRVTKNMYDINQMIYHIIKRVPGFMQVIEYAFDEIDIENIAIIKDRGNNNNTYFTDGKHEYHFSTSKNTLYMIFENCTILDSFEVDIMEDPFDYLMKLSDQVAIKSFKEPYIPDYKNKICLRLYSSASDGTKKVYEKSGLNQWNARGRKRNPNEIYIPYPVEDRERTADFFPPRETIFNLKLPDDKEIPAKVCQADGKAIMSNPNSVLGEWLLRKVFEIEEGVLVTYEMLEKYGIDSVIFTKNDELNYSIDFSEIGTYEEFYSK
jgi:hypothetical protein